MRNTACGIEYYPTEENNTATLLQLSPLLNIKCFHRNQKGDLNKNIKKKRESKIHPAPDAQVPMHKQKQQGKPK